MTKTASWPAQADYRDALQNLDVAFREPDLRTCNVERNRMGVPRARSGAFASVYKLTRANGQAFALKLFNFPSEDRQRRYELVSNHLRVLGPKRPACLVDFKYALEGIRIQGKWYPTQTMPWVTGQTLGQWLRDRMLAKQFPAVRKLADDWVQMVTQLQEAKIAHGDLQHDNVMVANDKLLLVDYDGMCVPGLEGVPQLEFGKPAYQHPSRGAEPLSLDVDNFSAWVILVALRACAADPNLYMRFVEKAENENILFSELELKEPDKSQLWPELARSPDADVRAWSTELRRMLGGEFSAIPRLNLNPYARLTELCQGNSPDWDAIHGEATRLISAGKALPTQPANLPKLIEEAKKRVAVRDRIRAALMAKDYKTVIAIYDPAIFAGWTNQTGLAKQAARAKEQSELLEKMQAAVRVSDGGRTVVKVWDEHGPKLNGMPEAEVFRQQAEGWRAKLAALEKLRTALKSNNEKAIAEAWQQFQKVGMHPEVKPDEAERARQSLTRAERLTRLKAIPNTLSESSDRALLSAWDDSLKGIPEAEKFMLMLDSVRKRIQLVNALAKAVTDADRGTGSEQAISAAAAALPKDYDHSHKARVLQAREGEQQLTELNAALAKTPGSDQQIATAWENFTAKHPAQAAKLDATRRQRCELAVERRNLIASLQKCLGRNLNDYEKDAKLYGIWKPNREKLEGSPDVASYLPRIQLAHKRLKAWTNLQSALQAKDLPRVLKFADVPELQTYPPYLEVANEIAEFTSVARWMKELSAKLQGAIESKSLPITREDLTKMQQNAARFDDKFRSAVSRMITSRITKSIAMEVSEPAYQLLSRSVPTAKICWTWDGSPLVSKFQICVTPDEPWLDAKTAPREFTSTCRPEDYARDQGGRMVLLNAGDADEVWAVVWPVVELGWETVYGAPIKIGPIPGGGA